MSNKADRSIHRDPMREIDVMLLDSFVTQDESDRRTRQSSEGIWTMAAVLGLMLALVGAMVANQVSPHADIDTVSIGQMLVP
jgi:hypothetical protein